MAENTPENPADEAAYNRSLEERRILMRQYRQSRMADDSGNEEEDRRKLRESVDAVSAEIPEPLYALALRQAQAMNNLVESYADIRDRAEKGEPISAADYNASEKAFNEVTTKIKKEVDENIAQFAVNEEEAGALSKAYWKKVGVIHGRLPDSMRTILTSGSEFDKSVALNDTGILEQAFAESVIAQSPYVKNPNVRAENEGALLTGLLAKNRGVAVADQHDQSEAAELISRHMKELKNAGVDTIYLEAESGFDKLAQLSIDELKEFAKRNARPRGVETSDDVLPAIAEMLIEAKKNDIRLVNIDKKDPARTFEAIISIDHRIASTNFIWADNIEADRQALYPDGDKGKFVVCAGAAHFFNRGHSQGLVDEALGIPVIDFTRRHKGVGTEVKREYSPNGADFYLSGGMDYPDKEKRARVFDRIDADMLLANSPLAELPGVSAVIGVLRKINEKAALKQGEELKNPAVNKSIEGESEIQVPAVPTARPNTQKGHRKDGGLSNP